MEFTVPTTKTAMYNTLKEIFYYYRIKRAEYEAVTLEELSIPRESYTAPTAAEYEAKAKALCAPAQELRLVAYKDGIQKEIYALTEKKKKIAAALAETEEKINAAYAEATERVKNEAAKRGLSDSSIAVTEIAKLAGEKSAALASANENADTETAAADAEISALNAKLSAASTRYSSVCEKEVSAKIVELKDKEAEKKRSAERYNAGASEKEQRYKNNLKEVQANLELKYIGIINSSEYTKDQLVDMGYYADVMDCVCGYYDTLSASAAYTDIKEESKLAIYLDDYYIDFVYLYKTRAGV